MKKNRIIRRKSESFHKREIRLYMEKMEHFLQITFKQKSKLFKKFIIDSIDCCKSKKIVLMQQKNIYITPTNEFIVIFYVLNINNSTL